MELDRTRRRQTVYEILLRSELESQVLALLKQAVYRNVQCAEYRDKIVLFVESDRYAELYREGEVNRKSPPVHGE